MTRVSSFPPVSHIRAKALILGSMPGAASLAAGQYYAHPRNHFWKIMGALIGAGPDVPYSTRLEILKKNNIALWDVLEACVRPGSLDSNITDECANDFAQFFAAHPAITHVFFNGGKAEHSFQKFVMPELEHLELKHLVLSPRKRGPSVTDNKGSRLRGKSRELVFTRLPSTSPANASYSFEKKLKAWRKIIL